MARRPDAAHDCIDTPGGDLLGTGIDVADLGRLDIALGIRRRRHYRRAGKQPGKATTLHHSITFSTRPRIDGEMMERCRTDCAVGTAAAPHARRLICNQPPSQDANHPRTLYDRAFERLGSVPDVASGP